MEIANFQEIVSGIYEKNPTLTQISYIALWLAAGALLFFYLTAKAIPTLRIHEKTRLPGVVTEAIAASKSHLVIVAHWLPTWVDNASIQTALEAGASVTIILQAADSPYLSARSQEMMHDPKWHESAYNTGMNRINQIRQNIKDAGTQIRLKVMTRDTIPFSLIIRADERYFLGPYWQTRQVADTMLIEGTKSSFVFSQIIRKEIDDIVSIAK